MEHVEKLEIIRQAWSTKVKECLTVLSNALPEVREGAAAAVRQEQIERHNFAVYMLNQAVADLDQERNDLYKTAERPRPISGP